MPVRMVVLCMLGTVLVSGCAMNRPLLSNDGPLFGDGGAFFASERTMLADNDAVEVSVSDGSWGTTEVIAANFEPAETIGQGDGPYRLDSGDRLRIFVYGQPNLSRIYVVDHQGRISVPLVGEINARGLTTFGLESTIRRQLEAEYVRDPHITVDIHQYRPFFILGEVRNGGQFPYVSGMTIETAIAIAGGYSERASVRKFRISRRVNGYVEKFDVSADYFLKPGDTVFVYERFF